MFTRVEETRHEWQGRMMQRSAHEQVRVPSFGSRFPDDLRTIASIADFCNKRLSDLPSPVRRSTAQADDGDAIRSTLTSARKSFLSFHAERVYEEITNRLELNLRIDELIDRAALRFPGILPSRDQMNLEYSRSLAQREGFEVDHGVFLQAILRSSRCGYHSLVSMLRARERSLEIAARLNADGAIRLLTLSIEIRGPAAHVTIENSDNLNSEDIFLVSDLEDAIDAIAMSPQIAVGILRGGLMDHRKYSGRRVFCSGINLKAFSRGDIRLVNYLMVRELGPLNKLRHGVLEQRHDHPGDAIQKPWLAVVDGFAIGGGMQMLLNVDRVIALRDSFFSLPAANEGIIPGLANFRLRNYAGGRLSRQIVLFGRKIDASDPEAALFCDEVVESDEVDDAIARAVDLLANDAVLANRRMINLAEESLGQVRSYLAEFAYQQAVRMYSRDVVSRVTKRSHVS